ncbi:C-type lectin domain family 3 member A [Merluccius polli]|uniref:C-type lectin domain family 3 member A n=1 Tax=Merluccius polli TaxID=89951 RepID=A0AA47MQC6_MERPO|nr:C-type lectin domain family 3 member A [Merluccius polli]
MLPVFHCVGILEEDKGVLKEEMDFISRHGSYYWLVASEVSEGMWRWVNGTVPVDNPSWSRGQHNGGREQNCLKFPSEQNQHKWADKSCEDENQALCEKRFI